MAEAGYRTPPGFELRPPLPSDVPALAGLSDVAFGPGSDRDLDIVTLRARNLVATAAPCSLVAERPSGQLAGLALTRQLGPIQLLAWAAVDPAEQGRGLLGAMLARWPGAQAGTRRLVISSTDPRAMRAYSRLGLSLLPTVSAGGILRPGAVTAPAGVRQCEPAQAATELAALGEAVRGAAYPPGDIAVMQQQGDAVHLVGDGEQARAAVVRRDGVIRLLVARDEQAAQQVLRAALAAVPPGATVHLNQLRAGMDWAIRVAADAGLVLSPEGPVFADWELDRLYLPNGSLG